MAKLTLNDITAGYGSNDLVNANNALIEAALENTLSRDGTTPNSMSADLDMNGQNIINVGSITTTAAATMQIVDELATTLIPTPVQSTWTSVGPTGSGADVIATPLDNIPTTSRGILAQFDWYVDRSSYPATPGQATTYFQTRNWGSTTAADNGQPVHRDTMYVFGYGWWKTTNIIIPLNGDNKFEYYWTHSFGLSAADDTVVSINYLGYIK